MRPDFSSLALLTQIGGPLLAAGLPFLIQAISRALARRKRRQVRRSVQLRPTLARRRVEGLREWRAA